MADEVAPSWWNWEKLKPLLWQALYAGVAAAVGYVFRELGGSSTPLNVIADGIRVTTGVGS